MWQDSNESVDGSYTLDESQGVRETELFIDNNQSILYIFAHKPIKS